MFKMKMQIETEKCHNVFHAQDEAWNTLWHKGEKRFKWR